MKRHVRAVTRRNGGRNLLVVILELLCQPLTSTGLAPQSWPVIELSNRRIRTRRSGGVGVE